MVAYEYRVRGSHVDAEECLQDLHMATAHLNNGLAQASVPSFPVFVRLESRISARQKQQSTGRGEAAADRCERGDSGERNTPGSRPAAQPALKLEVQMNSSSICLVRIAVRSSVEGGRDLSRTMFKSLCIAPAGTIPTFNTLCRALPQHLGLSSAV